MQATASIQIQKPVHEVFQAIIQQAHLSQYFIATASADMKSDTLVHWTFPEFDEGFDVHIKEIIENQSIEFDWSGGVPDAHVFIRFLPFNGDALITVSESIGKDGTVEQLIQQTEGWANFLACLKAYMEYGINLRKGAFLFKQIQ